MCYYKTLKVNKFVFFTDNAFAFIYLLCSGTSFTTQQDR